MTSSRTQPVFNPQNQPETFSSPPVPATGLSLAEQVRRTYNPLIRQIRNIEKPVIAAVNGIAAGTGLGLALACDIRYASQNARFVEVSVRIGLLPGSGTGYFLPRLIGLSKALEMAFNGDELDAQAAEKYGLVSRVIAGEALLEETRKLGLRLAKGPTRAIGLTKMMMYRSSSMNLEQAWTLRLIWWKKPPVPRITRKVCGLLTKNARLLTRGFNLLYSWHKICLIIFKNALKNV